MIRPELACQEYHELVCHRMSESGYGDQRCTTVIPNEGFMVDGSGHENNLEGWVSLQESLQFKEKKVSINRPFMHLNQYQKGCIRMDIRYHLVHYDV